MDLALTKTIAALNYLYHEGLNGDDIERNLFTEYVMKIRSNNLKFISATPDVEFEGVVMNEYETMLHERLQFVLLEIQYGKENKLQNYYEKMAGVELGLIHELSTLLMKREAININYFWLHSPNTIAFNWSGDAMDIAVWWEKDVK